MLKSLKIIDKTTSYQGFFRIDLVRYQHSLYRGGQSAILRRELFGRGEAAVLLLYDMESQLVFLIEQCRAGALSQAQTHDQPELAWLLEPIAGMIDPGESPLQAALREAEEEAGVVLNDAEFICKFFPSPGGCDEVLHLFAAAVSSSEVAQFAGLAEHGEDIRVVPLPFAEAYQRLVAGEFTVASTLIALQWLFLQGPGRHSLPFHANTE
ncbi:MAG: NUDIX domain-containing protein [Thiotrichales bacterium]|nr:NUDIX domain-containing protein [Thiotrichales bacterium]